ncbi:MAG: hypothetical protein ACKVVP_16710 [Chloroflexota bacterium]
MQLDEEVELGLLLSELVVRGNLETGAWARQIGPREVPGRDDR